MTNTPEYYAWAAMLQRCQSPTSQSYDSYGGRGITVCEAWQDFETFYRDMGPRPSPQHTLERLRNHEGYRPDNCIWATWTMQARNKRTTVYLTHNNTTMSLAAWAELSPVSYQTFLKRINYGWSMEDALTIPPERKGRPKRRPKA